MSVVGVAIDELIVELAGEPTPDRRTAERLAAVVRAALELVGRRVAALSAQQRARVHDLVHARVELSTKTLLAHHGAERLADAIVEQLMQGSHHAQ